MQGINCQGFHGDTMHMARLWNSSRTMGKGYSLEVLPLNMCSRANVALRLSAVVHISSQATVDSGKWCICRR